MSPIGTIFYGNTEITSFDELKYFTGINNNYNIRDTTLTKIIFPAIAGGNIYPKIAINNNTVEYVKVMDGANVSIRGDNYNTYNLIRLLYIHEGCNLNNTYIFRNIHINNFYVNIQQPKNLHFAYGDTLNNCDTIYVPIGCAEAYKKATNWSSYEKDFWEYDFEADGRGIRPHLEYTKEIQSIESALKNGYIETILTPRNAVRDLTYAPSDSDIIEVHSDGSVIAKKIGECDIQVKCNYKPLIISLVHVSIQPSESGTFLKEPDSIDTGIPLTLNTKMYIKFVNMGMSVMMGLSGSSWDSKDSMYFNSRNESQLRFMNNGQIIVDITPGEIIEVVFENGKVTINGVEYITGIRTGSAIGTIKLFNNGYPMSEPNFIGRFYEAKIYEGGKLLKRYVGTNLGSVIEIKD